MWTRLEFVKKLAAFDWIVMRTLGKAHGMRATILSLFLPAIAAATPFFAAACSSSSAGPPAAVSFKSDVMPIFEHSCGISSSCHGDPSDVAARGIYLGCDMMSPSCNATSDPTHVVYAGIVSGADGGGPRAPLEITGMPFITPGDPTKSYLMHKMDDDLGGLTGCIANNAAVLQAADQPGSVSANVPPNWCGTFMPYNVEVLPKGTRDTVRAWITQGALNN